MKVATYLSLVFFVAAWSGDAFAHSGGLDEYGCHRNSSTGVYHCHDSSNDTENGGGSSGLTEDEKIVLVALLGACAVAGVVALLYVAFDDSPSTGRARASASDGDASPFIPDDVAFAPLDGGGVGALSWTF